MQTVLPGSGIPAGAMPWWVRRPPVGQEPTRATTGDGGIGRAKRRILIVEDEWLVSLQIEQTLTAAGLEIVGTAGDAATAVALAGRHRPDLVLMDIRLQGELDGISAAREIAERFGIPSLFVSAHTDQRTMTRSLAVRPAGWLPKPFTKDELVKAVQAALDVV